MDYFSFLLSIHGRGILGETYVQHGRLSAEMMMMTIHGVIPLYDPKFRTTRNKKNSSR
jgi:hypothetical protein